MTNATYLRKKIGNITEAIFSGGTPDTRKPEYWNGNLMWLSSGETSQPYITRTKKMITQEGAKNSSTRLAKKGDVVIASAGQGNTRGQTSFLKNDMYINQSIISLRANPNLLDSLYLYYNISSRYKELRALSEGNSIRGSLTTKIIADLEIFLPPLSEQKRISSILSSFDNKIEQLKKENNILEDIAQNIFKEWFVKYNFPNKDGKPYKDNNGKMIDSELGLIPEGWRVEKVGDVIKTVLGGTPDTTKAEYWSNGTIPWINSGKVNDFRIYEPTTYITQKALNESATKLMPTGTVVIAITGATLGQVSKLEIDAAGNQSVIGIQPNRYFSSSYLYYWMLENIQILIDHATGGAQQHINKNDVDNSLFLTPKENILKDNTDVLSRLSDKISNNCFQINNLSSARESLLSKLIRIISL